MNDFAVTCYFKDIAPDADSFNALVGKYTDIAIAGQEAAIQPVYRVLFNRFCNSNINYDSADAFCRHFFQTFEDEYPRYIARRKLISKQYDMTDDELVSAGEYINNTAYKPNSKIDDPLNTVVPFISQQQSGKSRLAKIEAYLRALDSFTNGYMRDFADKFRPHFIAILPTGEYIYERS